MHRPTQRRQSLPCPWPSLPSNFFTLVSIHLYSLLCTYSDGGSSFFRSESAVRFFLRRKKKKRRRTRKTAKIDSSGQIHHSFDSVVFSCCEKGLGTPLPIDGISSHVRCSPRCGRLVKLVESVELVLSPLSPHSLFQWLEQTSLRA